MTQKTTTQTQQKDDAAATAAGAFDKMTEENIARMESFFTEWTKVRDRSVEQTQTAIDEAAKLMKEQMTYGAKLASEWQRLTLESSRQMAQMMSKPFSLS